MLSAFKILNIHCALNVAVFFSFKLNVGNQSLLIYVKLFRICMQETCLHISGLV